MASDKMLPKSENGPDLVAELIEELELYSSEIGNDNDSGSTTCFSCVTGCSPPTTVSTTC